MRPTEDPRPQMLSNARQRARKAGVPFGITAADIVVPSHCPVLGIPLVRHLGKKGGGDSSPSLDRIKPELGYVRGNIIVVSRRANRIKTDATPEELEAVADFYRWGKPRAKVRAGRRARVTKDPA